MSINKKRAGVLLGLAGTAAATALIAMPNVSAAQPATSPTGQNCVYNVDTNWQGCYATADQSDIVIADSQGKGDIVIGKFFKDKQFGGATLTMVSTDLCDGDEDDVDHKRELNGQWANSISSAEAWGSCKVILHAKPKESGNKSREISGDLPQLNSGMNNNAESVTFR